jgi:hypothetical protein
MNRNLTLNELKNIKDIRHKISNPKTDVLEEKPLIELNLGGIYFNKYRLVVKSESSIILNIRGKVLDGQDHILIIKKEIVGDCTISLTGKNMTFLGTGGADLKTTPNIVLSGAANDVFIISFLVDVLSDNNINLIVATGLNAN